MANLRHRDLKEPRWMLLKAVGFIVIGLMSASLIVLKLARWDTVILLAITVWAFARAYYFAFYVIHHYIDPEFQYAGLLDMVVYYWRNRGTNSKMK